MPFWRGRDRERFIGSYDPEHEMPDPDRMNRDRYESEAYRRNAADSRYGYRWNPDRIEDRFVGRGRSSMPRDWNRDARDHSYNERYGARDYERSGQWESGRDFDRDRDRDRSYGADYGMADYGRNPQGGYGRNFGNPDRGYDRGYGHSEYGRSDYGRNDYGRNDGRGDYGRSDYDRGFSNSGNSGRSLNDRDRHDRERNFGDGRTMPDWDREARAQHDRDYGWDDVGDISWERNRGRRY